MIVARENILFQTHDLDIGYDQKSIYEGLNVQLSKGTLTCLLGQNGVGKSTLLKTIAGLLPRKSGDLSLNGSNIDTVGKAELARNLSIVTTEKLTAGGLSVMDVLMAGRYPHQSWVDTATNDDFVAIQRAIDQTKINYLLGKNIGELSDGQRQKVMIARALVQDGELILLDEPTAHLDLTNRVEIMRLLREIATKANKGILVSTHELNLALQFSDKLWLMNFGERLVEGSPEDLALSGDLDRIFHHQEFEYDLMTGKVIRNDNPQRNFTIEANEELTYWIQNAIERHSPRVENPIIITAKIEKNVVIWEIKEGSNSYNGVTVDGLIRQLQELRHEPTPNE